MTAPSHAVSLGCLPAIWPVLLCKSLYRYSSSRSSRKAAQKNFGDRKRTFFPAIWTMSLCIHCTRAHCNMARVTVHATVQKLAAESGRVSAGVGTHSTYWWGRCNLIKEAKVSIYQVSSSSAKKIRCHHLVVSSTLRQYHAGSQTRLAACWVCKQSFQGLSCLLRGTIHLICSFY